MIRGAALTTALLVGACSTPNSPEPSSVDFVVDVAGERFVLRTTNADTIRLATENLQGGNRRFPSGPRLDGGGGFNAPWSWHLDPDRTQMVEAAIEVCDGKPSYVEAHQADFPTYCPWAGRIVERR
jgi:hypothetical protein